MSYHNDYEAVEWQSYNKFCKKNKLDVTLKSNFDTYVKHIKDSSNDDVIWLNKDVSFYMEPNTSTIIDLADSLKKKYHTLKKCDIKFEDMLSHSYNDSYTKASNEEIQKITNGQSSDSANADQGVQSPAYWSTMPSDTNRGRDLIETLSDTSQNSQDDNAYEDDTGDSDDIDNSSVEYDGTTYDPNISGIGVGNPEMSNEEAAKACTDKVQDYKKQLKETSTNIVDQYLNYMLQQKINDLKTQNGIDVGAAIPVSTKNADLYSQTQQLIRSFFYAVAANENQKIINKTIEDTASQLHDVITNQIGKDILEPFKQETDDIKKFSEKLDFLSKLSDIDLANKVGSGLNDVIINNTGIGNFVEKLKGIDQNMAEYGITSNFSGAVGGLITHLCDIGGADLQKSLGGELPKIAQEVSGVSKVLSEVATQALAYENIVSNIVDTAETIAEAFIQREEGLLIDEVSKFIKIDLNNLGGIEGNIGNILSGDLSGVIGGIFGGTFGDININAGTLIGGELGGILSGGLSGIFTGGLGGIINCNVGGITASSLLNNIGGGLLNNIAGGVIGNITNGITGAINNITGGIIGDVTGAVNNITGGITGEVNDIIGDVTGGVTDAVSDVVDDVTGGLF